MPAGEDAARSPRMDNRSSMTAWAGDSAAHQLEDVRDDRLDAWILDHALPGPVDAHIGIGTISSTRPGRAVIATT